MENLTYQMGQEKAAVTPAIKDVFSNLERLVREQQGKLPEFKEDDKKQLTSEVVQKIKLG